MCANELTCQVIIHCDTQCCDLVDSHVNLWTLTSLNPYAQCKLSLMAHLKGLKLKPRLKLRWTMWLLLSRYKQHFTFTNIFYRFLLKAFFPFLFFSLQNIFSNRIRIYINKFHSAPLVTFLLMLWFIVCILIIICLLYRVFTYMIYFRKINISVL